MSLVSFRITEEEKQLLRIVAAKEGYANLTACFRDIMVESAKEDYNEEWQQIIGTVEYKNNKAADESVEAGVCTDGKEAAGVGAGRTAAALRRLGH